MELTSTHLEETLTVDGGAGREAAAEPAGGFVTGIVRRGSHLGRYEILHGLGTGGMGNVYAARDPQLDRRVALKILRRASRQEGLLREARAAARVIHPHVAVVHDAGTFGSDEERRPFVAMELVDGRSLDRWLATGERSWRQVLRVFVQAGRGLAAAHAAGVVHRDFKPSNVMLGRDGMAKVVDFGLASVAGDGEDVRAGTPAYLAPEQYEGAPVDPRADQFSFAVALYEALYGELPFDGDTLAERQQAIRAGRLRTHAVKQEGPLSNKPGSRRAGKLGNKPVPPWLRRVLVRALAAQPEARYASMDDLLDALTRARVRRQRRWTLVAAALLLLVAGVVGAGWRAQEQAQLCSGGPELWRDVWDETRRAQVTEAFVASGAPRASQQLQVLTTGLDRVRDEWLTMHRAACEATRVVGEQSEELLDRRMLCLDGQRRDLAELVELLAQADPALVLRAPEIAAGLPSARPCADRAALLAKVVSPPAAQAESVEQTRISLARANALRLVARYGEAEQAAIDALEQARRLDYGPLTAEARYSVAMTAGRLGRHDELRQGLLESASLSWESGHDEQLARSLLTLIIAEFMHGDTLRARQWAGLAQAAIGRLSDRDDLEALRHFYLGMLDNLDERPGAAIEHFRAALALDPSPSPWSRANTLNNLAVAYRQQGRFDEARAGWQEALSILQQLYGDQHPQSAGSHGNLGNLEMQVGRVEAAREHYQQALDLYEARLGPRHPELIRLLAVYARAELALDHLPAAQRHAERAVALARAEPDSDPSARASAFFELARVRARQETSKEPARRLAHEAGDLWRQAGPRSEPELVAVETWLASLDGGEQP